MEKETQRKTKRSGTASRILLKILCILLETVLLAVVSLYGVMYVLAKGPSPTATKLFVRSVRETSAVGFLANLFFTDEEIALMEKVEKVEEFEEMDPGLIEIPTPTETQPGVTAPTGPVPDAWGLVDEDGDGIIIENVKGQGYNGYMMVVLDPSRVIMATNPEDYGVRGYTVADMVKKYDAVAGINAGGFYDPEGRGNGSIPDTMVISGGQVYYPELGPSNGFVGFDSNHIMHVGVFSPEEARNRGIQSGVGFGPVLISNGVPRKEDTLSSGVNPRTGIGQRSDGAVLLLVIEGRMITSLGATYYDMVEIFLSYGAVNACNLDGGSSTVMYYEGEYINKLASLVGVRPVPTTFLVLKKGENANG